MGDTCRHRRGDTISEMGFWLCADCWARLESRPIKYGPNPAFQNGLRGSEPPQIVVWQAAVAESDGVTLNDFLRTMTRRFRQKTRPPLEPVPDGYDMAISVLSSLGEPYGDPSLDWSHDGARELADDEMQYWDRDGGEANA